MSALDTWSFFDSKRNYGVATFFPFKVDKLVVLPNTIPFETPLYFGFSKKHYAEYWRNKVERISHEGGLILINAHPDRWYCGNDSGIRAFEELIDMVLDKHDPIVMTALQVADQIRKQEEAGAFVNFEGEPPISVPRHT